MSQAKMMIGLKRMREKVKRLKIKVPERTVLLESLLRTTRDLKGKGLEIRDLWRTLKSLIIEFESLALALVSIFNKIKMIDIAFTLFSKWEFISVFSFYNFLSFVFYFLLSKHEFIFIKISHIRLFLWLFIHFV